MRDEGKAPQGKGKLAKKKGADEIVCSFFLRVRISLHPGNIFSSTSGA
jgi:hypothetical protein